MISERKTKLKHRIILALVGVILSTAIFNFGGNKSALANSECIVTPDVVYYTFEINNYNLSLQSFPDSVTEGENFNFGLTIKSPSFDPSKPPSCGGSVLENGDPKENPYDVSNIAVVEVFYCFAESNPGNCELQGGDPAKFNGDPTIGEVTISTGFTPGSKWQQNPQPIPVNIIKNIIHKPGFFTVNIQAYRNLAFASDKTHFYYRGGGSTTVQVKNVNPESDKTKNLIKVEFHRTGPPTSSEGTVPYTISATLPSTAADSDPVHYTWTWYYVDSATDTNLQRVAKDPSQGANSISLDLDIKKDTYLVAKAVPSDSSAKTLYSAPTFIPVKSDPVNQDSVAANQGSGACLSGVSNFLLCIVETVVGVVVDIVKGFIYLVFALIVAPLMQAVLTIHPSDPSFAAVILEGWVVIRNLMNIIFILALIVMAMATLFRVGEQYNYKHLMVAVVLAALFVNFSLAIAQAILSIADTFQAQFLPANGTVVQSLAAQLIVGPFLIQQGTIPLTGTFAGVMTSLLSLVFAIGAFFALTAVTAFLVIRIVAIWILLLVSPIAYAGFAFPLTHGFAEKWWTYFFKYAFFTPIMGLFLHLCALIGNAQQTYVGTLTVQTFTSDVGQNFGPITQSINNSVANLIFKVLTNVLMVGCLFGTLQIAQEFSIAGAAKIVDLAKKGALGAIKYPAGAAWREISKKRYQGAAAWATAEGRFGFLKRMTARALAPGEALKARKERVERNLEKKKELAAGRFKQASKLFAEGIDNEAGDEAAKEQVEHESAKYVGNDVETTKQNLERALKSGQKDEIMAVIWAATKNGRLKDVMRDFMKDAGQTDENGNLTPKAEFLKSYGFTGNVDDYENPDVYMNITDKMLGKGFAQDQFLAKQMTQWAKENGRLEWLYHRVPSGNDDGTFKSAAEAMNPADIGANNQIRKYIEQEVAIYQKTDIDKEVRAAGITDVDSEAYKNKFNEIAKAKANTEIGNMSRRQWEVLDLTVKRDRNEIVDTRMREGFLDATGTGSERDMTFFTKVMRDSILTRADASTQLGAKVKNLADTFHIKGVDAETGALIIDEDHYDEVVNSITYEDIDPATGVVRTDSEGKPIRKVHEHLYSLLNATVGVLTGNKRVDRNGNNGAAFVAVDKNNQSVAGKAGVFTTGGVAKALTNFGAGATGTDVDSNGKVIGQVLISEGQMGAYNAGGVKVNLTVAGSKTKQPERSIRQSANAPDTLASD